MATKKSNDCPLEGYEQQRFCKWLDDHDILYFAIPNGGYRKKETARAMQYRGVKKGVPDLFICEQQIKEIKEAELITETGVVLKPEETQYDVRFGLFIEMKRQKRSYPTIDQKI